MFGWMELGSAASTSHKKKAYTSRAFDIATRDLATDSQSGGQFFGIHVVERREDHDFVVGIPLRRDGKVVGAIGVSGGSGDQDHAVAEAGAAAFSRSRTTRAVATRTFFNTATAARNSSPPVALLASRSRMPWPMPPPCAPAHFIINDLSAGRCRDIDLPPILFVSPGACQPLPHQSMHNAHHGRTS